MKRILTVSILVLGTYFNINAQCIPSDPAVESQVEAILAEMTLQEKIGQMCELTVEALAPENGEPGGLLSDRKVQEAFTKYKLGSVLNVPGYTAQTPEVWAELIHSLNEISAAETGIAQIYGVDQIHGASYTKGATLFPQEIGQGASFNPEISRRIGEITAYESRACLIPWVYSPVMDIARSPLWPRMWESFGEDVLVNSVMASALTKGLQGEDPNHVGMYNVAACLKHYMAYGAAVSGKDRTPSSVTYREMLEKHFQPFKACCEAGSLSIMVNSANNNGVPFHVNRRLLTEWLKEGLNWDGMIVTDWADIDNIWKRDKVAATKKDAIAMAINAGIDMSMDPYSLEFCTLLEELVNEGRVPMERIDDAVRRILRLKIRVGLLDMSTWEIPAEGQYADFASDKFAAEAVRIAEECMVLLKNEDDILPLEKGTRIFVCGPNADSFRSMNGGWTYTWQGQNTDAIAREIGKYKTFYEAISDKFGAENVEFSEMVRYDDKDFNIDYVIDTKCRKAKKADVIIACIGENSYTETPGNINDLTLSRNQIEMVKSLASLGKPVVLVLNEGRPRLINEIAHLVQGIVHTFLPGNYGGIALANLLAGDANFSGRLPFTYPKYHGSFITYDFKPCEQMEAMAGAYNYDANTPIQWPFGFGLSYSKVEYSDLKVLEAGENIKICVNVKNVSSRAVKEPVLLYISDKVASLTPDIKRLRAFEKVNLEPGESKTVVFNFPAKDLSFVDEELNWVLEPGEFGVEVADLKASFVL